MRLSCLLRGSIGGTLLPSPGELPDSAGPNGFTVYADVFPEHIFHLVCAFQRRSRDRHVRRWRQGCSGTAAGADGHCRLDGDRCGQGGSILLTTPRLGGIVTCVKEGRPACQRVLTYTLNILINECGRRIAMGCGLVMIGHAVLTPPLRALMMLAADFVTMAWRADGWEFGLRRLHSP